MICTLCGGSGNLACFQKGKSQVEFFTCPSCHGFGCRYDVTGNPILVEIQENFRADIRTRFVGKGRRTDEDAKASFLETRKSYALPDIPQEVKAEMHGAKMDARHSHLNSLMD